mgnify:CR=1 FL=1|tara:strand:- start:1710 stop:1958 length:249 start_codon:yes stop_codon:yes gene_type:complete
MGTPFREPDSSIQMTPKLRRRLEATIEHRVSLMDAIDGSPELEEDADNEDSDPAEPWLCWTLTGNVDTDTSNQDLECENFAR